MPGFPLAIGVTVLWGDQDSLGHVNHAVYLRWFESVRFAYLNLVGLERARLEQGVGPILAGVKCNYRRQLSFPDRVQVGARAVRIGRTSVTLEHHAYSATHGAVVADSEAAIVVFDFRAQKPVPVPEDIRSAIEKLEGRTLSG